MSINDFTGNGIISETVYSGTGSRLPVSIDMIYNTNDNIYPYFEGELVPYRGWRTSFNQTLLKSSKSLTERGYPYVYTDADGTPHYFYKKKNSTNTTYDEYEDEDGLGLTLQIPKSNPKYNIILDKQGNKLEFYQPSEGGVLYRCTNSFGQTNLYTSTKSGSARYITKITDGAKRDVLIAYTAAPHDSSKKVIKSITYPDGKVVTFTWKSQKYNNATPACTLSKITYSDGQWVEYVADKYLRITQITASNGKKINLSYANNRVIQIKESAKNGSSWTPGNYLNITYNPDFTRKFVDNKGLTETYQFDHMGRATNVIGPDGSVSVATFTSDTKSSGKTNKVSSAAGAEKYVKNYITDPSAESGSAYYKSNWDGKTSVTQTYCTDTAQSNGEDKQFLGGKSLQVTHSSSSDRTNSSWGQLLDAAPFAGKTVTVSAYVKTSGVTKTKTNGGAGIHVTVRDSNATPIVNSWNRITGTQKWQRLTTTIKVPSSGAEDIRVYLGLFDAKGTVWIDCVQLEISETANEFNLLGPVGDFGHASWNMSSDTNSGDTRKKLVGEDDKKKLIYYAMPVNKKNVSFKLTATVQGNAVPVRDSRAFDLAGYFFYADGTKGYHYCKFNQATGNTQTASFVIVPKADVEVTKVEIGIRYYQQQNTLNLKTAMVNIDETGTSYTYDSKGNVISSKDNAVRNQAYSYSDANELTQYTNEKNETYKYTYDKDNKHKLVAARSNQRGNDEFQYRSHLYNDDLCRCLWRQLSHPRGRL